MAVLVRSPCTTSIISAPHVVAYLAIPRSINRYQRVKWMKDMTIPELPVDKQKQVLDLLI
jgi:hypothetical protein